MGRMSKRKKSPLVNHEVTWKTPLKAIDEEFEEVGPGMGAGETQLTLETNAVSTANALTGAGR